MSKRKPFSDEEIAAGIVAAEEVCANLDTYGTRTAYLSLTVLALRERLTETQALKREVAAARMRLAACREAIRAYLEAADAEIEWLTYGEQADRIERAESAMRAALAAAGEGKEASDGTE